MKKQKILDINSINSYYRNFLILLYPDSTSYNFNEVLINIKSLKYYAYIKHIGEVNSEDSHEFKTHFHVFIKFDSGTTCERVAKRLGIPLNFVQYVKNVRGACRYLTHIDLEEKTPYKLEDVKVSRLFQRKFLLNFQDIKTEEQIIQDIYYWIDNFHYNSYHDKLKYLIIFVNMNCYDTIFKRYRFEFIDYLKTHL